MNLSPCNANITDASSNMQVSICNPMYTQIPALMSQKKTTNTAESDGMFPSFGIFLLVTETSLPLARSAASVSSVQKMVEAKRNHNSQVALCTFMYGPLRLSFRAHAVRQPVLTICSGPADTESMHSILLSYLQPQTSLHPQTN